MRACRVGPLSLPFPPLAGAQVSPQCPRRGYAVRGAGAARAAAPQRGTHGERAAASAGRDRLPSPSAAGRDRRGPRRSAEPGAWHLRRGRRSFSRCHTDRTRPKYHSRGFHKFTNTAVYFSSVIAPRDLKCRVLGCISWEAVN